MTLRNNHKWGHYYNIYEGPRIWIRALTLRSGESLSLHYHQYRKEFWIPLQPGLSGVINGTTGLDLRPGKVYSVPCNILHRVINRTNQNLKLIAIGSGRVQDKDIIRIYKKD